MDSEDLPLNVGREILQRSKMLSVISKRLVRKSIDMFRKLAEDKEKYKVFCELFLLLVVGSSTVYVFGPAVLLAQLSCRECLPPVASLERFEVMRENLSPI